MPSFTKAISCTPAPSLADGTHIFRIVVDQSWSVFGTPHGGYLLSVIIKAINTLQESRAADNGSSGKQGGRRPPDHFDPAHLTASFLRAAKPGEAEVHLKVIKEGKSWTNIEAKMVQKGEPILLCQALYTLMNPLPSPSDATKPFSSANQTLLPLTPSAYSPITPFLTHPSSATNVVTKSNEYGRRWSTDSVLWFSPELMEWKEDGGIKKRREEGTEGGVRGEGKTELEWGAWCQFTSEEDQVDSASLPFFTDLMSSIPEVLPPNERVAPHYYPTLAMSIQFHVPLRRDSPSLLGAYFSAPKTVGCWGTGNAISEGRHEQRTEVWSAPGEIGESGEEKEGWRKKCVCLATATQIALSVPISGMKTGIPKPKGGKGESRL